MPAVGCFRAPGATLCEHAASKRHDRIRRSTFQGSRRATRHTAHTIHRGCRGARGALRRHDVAWDVGCGSGQAVGRARGAFGRVIATDPAQAQLDHAEAAPRVEYRCRPPRPAACPTPAPISPSRRKSAHWFDWPRFVVEAGRVARPGSLVALVTYRNAEVAGRAGARLGDYYPRHPGPLAQWPGPRRQPLPRPRVAVAGGRGAAARDDRVVDTRRAVRLHHDMVGDVAVRGGRRLGAPRTAAGSARGDLA